MRGGRDSMEASVSLMVRRAIGATGNRIDRQCVACAFDGENCPLLPDAYGVISLWVAKCG